jgi:transposase
MTRGKELLPHQRAQIVAFHECGVSQVDIAKKMKVTQSVISKTLQKYHLTSSFSSASRSGRPPVTSQRTDAMIHRLAVGHPMWSATDIVRQLPAPVSVDTVKRRLRRCGLHARRPAKKPLLSAKNRRDRIAFCRRYLHWTPAMWENVLFSDESQFHQFQAFPRYVRRPINTRFVPRFAQPTVRHSASIMVWASFSSRGIGDIWFLPPNTTMRAVTYLAVLQNHLVASMHRLGATTFQHDGAPCHTARLVKQWLQGANVEVMMWPGQSPDLNPIENLWQIMKRKVALRLPTGLQHLKEIIQDVWTTAISQEECRNLVATMPQRIRMVLKNKGGRCKN